jgi:hypothetical protein
VLGLMADVNENGVFPAAIPTAKSRSVAPSQSLRAGGGSPSNQPCQSADGIVCRARTATKFERGAVPTRRHPATVKSDGTCFLHRVRQETKWSRRIDVEINVDERCTAHKSSAQRTGVRLRAPEGAKRPTSPSAATPTWVAVVEGACSLNRKFNAARERFKATRQGTC